MNEEALFTTVPTILLPVLSASGAFELTHICKDQVRPGFRVTLTVSSSLLVVSSHRHRCQSDEAEALDTEGRACFRERHRSQARAAYVFRRALRRVSLPEEPRSVSICV